jgi:hypothetical protein
MLVAHAYNSSYLGGWAQEDHILRLTRANSLWDPISKNSQSTWPEGVTQVVENLLCKYEVQFPNSLPKLKKIEPDKWEIRNRILKKAKQLDLRDIYRATSTTTIGYMFLKCTWIFLRIDHMLGHELSFSRFKKIPYIGSSLTTIK